MAAFFPRVTAAAADSARHSGGGSGTMGVATTIGTGGDGNGGDTKSAALVDLDFGFVVVDFRRRDDVLRWDWDMGNEIRIERRVDTCLFSVWILPWCEGPAPAPAAAAAAAAGGGFVMRVVKLALLGQKVSTQSFAVPRLL